MLYLINRSFIHSKTVLLFVKFLNYTAQTLEMEKAMGNTYKDNPSRKGHKNLKPHQLNDEISSFSARHAVYTKKKRNEHNETDIAGAHYGNQRKMRAAQDIRARRAERHALNSDVHMDPPSKGQSPTKNRGVKWDA